MLNVKEINKVLLAAPLCRRYIIHQRGMANEYCAMGALAKAVGASDKYLKETPGDGVGIWRDFGDKLNERFGIESLEQFQTFMDVNDKIDSPIERNKTVAKHTEALSAEQVNKLLDVNMNVNV